MANTIFSGARFRLPYYATTGTDLTSVSQLTWTPSTTTLQINGGSMQVVRNSDVGLVFFNQHHSTTATTSFTMTRSRGTFTSQLPVQAGDYIGRFTFRANTAAGNTVNAVDISAVVDTGSVSVTVIEDGGSTTLAYTKTETLIGLTSLTRAYFVEAAENQQYEVRFGDNVFGRKPRDGSVIVVEYRTSSGELPNGASTFLNDGNIDTHANVSISTISSATGGAINETIESIRYNAPRNFQVQGRAVTATDYETILKANFGDIQSISAYGGEDLVPPQFGKVFISVDVQNADGTPANRIKTFSDFIKDKTPLTVDLVFVDPQFMYVKVVSDIKYNVNATTKLSSDIRTAVLSKISAHNTTNLEGFKKTIYYTKLTKDIDSADDSIISNDTEIRAIKIITPSTNTDQSFEIIFGFAFQSETGVVLNTDEYHYGHTIQSSPFTYEGYRSILVDDTRGLVYVAKLTSGVVEIKKVVGAVDYTNGIVTIQNLNVSDYEGTGIKVYARSNAKDFSSTKNVILAIKDEDVTVTVTPVKL